VNSAAVIDPLAYAATAARSLRSRVLLAAFDVVCGAPYRRCLLGVRLRRFEGLFERNPDEIALHPGRIAVESGRE